MDDQPRSCQGAGEEGRVCKAHTFQILKDNEHRNHIRQSTKGSNTEVLAESFAQGASSKHNVDFISVRDYHINPCMGCNSCFKRDDLSCIQKDDMQTVYDKLAKADMLVVASPVYFYGISSQLKALIDRCHNPIRDTFKIKKSCPVARRSRHITRTI